VSSDIGFVHRKLPFGEVYFLVNTSNRPVVQSGMFRVVGLNPEWWDPMTGKTSPAADTPLMFAPYESRFLVFGREPARPSPHHVATPSLVDLSGGWKVTFPDQTVDMKTLRSWTDDEATRYFSGRAAYERMVTVPAGMLRSPVFLSLGQGDPVTEDERRAGSGMRAMLEGPVREAAAVYVNGKRAGSIWCPPYEIEVTSLLHAGDNAIRIVVANLALNAMAKGPLPDYKQLNLKYGERFQAQDMDKVKPIPAGLLGPIRLVSR
jgi:hypothetical protein